jgi:hypothetical protein
MYIHMYNRMQVNEFFKSKETELQEYYVKLTEASGLVWIFTHEREERRRVTET